MVNILANEETKRPTKFGYELLRYHVIPAILGKHEEDILYWVGKEIAREFPLFSLQELPDFFREADWGELIVEKEKSDSIIYTLIRPTVEDFEQASHALEAGFLAAQHEALQKRVTECYAEKNIKKQWIQFEVKWDASSHV